MVSVDENRDFQTIISWSHNRQQTSGPTLSQGGIGHLLNVLFPPVD